LPNGKGKITMIFEKNLWRLPIWTKTKARLSITSAKPKRQVTSTNPFAALASMEEDADEVMQCYANMILPENMTIDEKVEVIHDSHAHPCNSKLAQCYRHHKGKGFPIGFMTALANYECRTCALMKGVRTYRKSTWMKAKRQDRQKSKSRNSGNSEPVTNTVTSSLVTKILAKQRLKDDFLTAMPANATDDADNDNDLFINFAHTIALGYKNERYYLVMVIGGVDFLWASPTTTTSKPEELLQEFVTLTRIKIQRIRLDGTSVFVKSSSFLAWIERHGAIICPATGYNHTMNSRSENAVRICKEHVRCALKKANAPLKFWPWALTTFCRTFNHWPSKGGASPWERMPDNNFYVDYERDLVPFACYAIGKIPREHPLVTDTTHSDRALEGAFLGFDTSTLSAWIYSFKLQRPIRVSDLRVSPRKFPFRDTSCVLTPGSLTDDQVLQMH
jgi:hypothetical protein